MRAGLRPGQRYTLSLFPATARRCASRGSFRHFRDETSARSTCESVLHLRGRARSAQIPSERGAQPAVPRALSFQPDAAVANGDHVYWDQLAPFAGIYNTPDAIALAGGKFDRSGVVLGGDNEDILKRIGNCADRLDLQDRFSLGPDVLHPGRSRLFRQ